MKTYALLSIFFVQMVSCVHVMAQETPPEPAVYSGHYAWGFEASNFVPCGASESWWVSGGINAKDIAPYAKNTNQFPPMGTDSVFIKVKGLVGAPGKYGHMGLYTRELNVLEVLEVHEPKPGDC